MLFNSTSSDHGQRTSSKRPYLQNYFSFIRGFIELCSLSLWDFFQSLFASSLNEICCLHWIVSFLRAVTKYLNIYCFVLSMKLSVWHLLGTNKCLEKKRALLLLRGLSLNANSGKGRWIYSGQRHSWGPKWKEFNTIEQQQVQAKPRLGDPQGKMGSGREWGPHACGAFQVMVRAWRLSAVGERLQDLKQGDDVMCTEVTLAPVQSGRA